MASDQPVASDQPEPAPESTAPEQTVVPAAEPVPAEPSPAEPSPVESAPEAPTPDAPALAPRPTPAPHPTPAPPATPAPEAAAPSPAPPAPAAAPSAPASSHTAPPTPTPHPPTPPTAALQSHPMPGPPAEHHPVPGPPAPATSAAPHHPVPGPPQDRTTGSPGAGSTWGRIDDEGAVYVRTADGERRIGSWQAGDAEAGLAYYHRRYDDLATEVELLERRLESGSGDAKATWTQAGALGDSLVDAAVIGDLGALDTRLAAVKATAEARMAEQVLEREQHRSDAIAAKEKLIAEAEKIASSGSQWKSAGDRLRAIVEEWKQIRGIDRKTDDALWKRYAAARDAFGKRRGQHFATLDSEHATAKAAKEKLVARAEELSDSTDWRDTANAMKRLMTEWKDAGRAGRGDEDALWARFRGAQDKFFSHRSAVFAERDAGEKENQTAKEAVIAEVEALDVSKPGQAQQQLRKLQDRFDAIGHVPRDAMRRLDDRMKAAEDRVRGAADARRSQNSVESNPFLAELRARLTEAEQKLERAQKSGDTARIAKAQAEVDQRRSLLPS